MDVPIQYRIKTFGKYTKGVYTCPECYNDMMDRMYEHIVGFNRSSIGWLKVIECDKCFCKFSSHMMSFDLEHFEDAINSGEQVHFKK